MIKREFVENNLLKILNYLPAHIVINNKEYYFYMIKLYSGKYLIYYADENNITLYFPKSCITLANAIVSTITELDKYIPNFANNLINI